MAAVWPDQPFTAIYETNGNFGKSTRKVVWDGHGHGRTEIAGRTGTNIGIIDAKSQSVTMCMPGSAPIHVPLTDRDAEQMGLQVESIVSGRTPIGSRVIDGHLCTGQRYSMGDYTIESWFDPSIKQNRQTITTHPQLGVTTSHLVFYSAAAPDPAQFVVTQAQNN
jgi:hypothetical protein